MTNIKNNAATQETRRKLIEAAGEVFAAQGLHAATIKEITTKAGVNTAAINYHFRDKFELYAAVVRYALDDMCNDEFAFKELTGTPEEQLQELIHDMFEDTSDPARPSWCTTILAHEFAQPTLALDAVVEELIRPHVDRMDNLIRQILGPQAKDKQVLQAALSVVSQCIHYFYNRELIQRLHPQIFEECTWQDMAEHIARFSIAGLRDMSSE
ncbi:MAG: hypothetical protein CMJ19_16665 [Phycisphaeraceae bacterium]|nr:hypothetical protein [Phycisphaeraceae bacterium]